MHVPFGWCKVLCKVHLSLSFAVNVRKIPPTEGFDVCHKLPYKTKGYLAANKKKTDRGQSDTVRSGKLSHMDMFDVYPGNFSCHLRTLVKRALDWYRHTPLIFVKWIQHI